MYYNNNSKIIPQPIVAICNMDENWGWLSSHITNRTVHWGTGLGVRENIMVTFNRKVFQKDEVKEFLDGK